MNLENNTIKELPKIATREELIELGAKRIGKNLFEYRDYDLGVVAGWMISEQGLVSKMRDKYEMVYSGGVEFGTLH